MRYVIFQSTSFQSHLHPPQPRQWSAGFLSEVTRVALGTSLQHHLRQLLLYLSEAKLSFFSAGCAANPLATIAV